MVREVGSLEVDGVPEFSPEVVESLAQYQNYRACVFSDWGRDADHQRPYMLIRTRFADTMQVHRVDRPLGMRFQLTFFDEPVASVSENPDPCRKQAILLRDSGGSECYQVSVLSQRTGKATLVSSGKGRHGGVKWSNSGKHVVYYSTARNGKDFDVIVDAIPPECEVFAPERIMCLELSGMWTPIAFSPDDEAILLMKIVSSKQSELWVVRGGILKQLKKGLVADDELQPIHHRASAKFSREKTPHGVYGVYYCSDVDSEFQRLHFMVFDFEDGLILDECLTPDLRWDVQDVEVTLTANAEHDLLAYTVNEDGLGALYLRRGRKAESESVPLPQGQVHGLSFLTDSTSTLLGMTLNGPHTPGDVYVLKVETMEVERWTQSEVGGLDPDTFVSPELVRFPTFDERTIPAFVYRPLPTSISTPAPVPVVVHIHGGPEGQTVPTFSPVTQAMVDLLGVCVIEPNVRGSVGYGKSFVKLDDGYLREDSVKDIGALLDWIDKQPHMDSKRVGVYGGSYGGYMVLACLIRYDKRLKCGAEIVGISNFVTFLENTSDYRRDHRRGEYGDERDDKMREFLHKISPLTSADRIRSPMLIGQGRNDPRVPESESVQIRDAVRQNGQEVWYILAKDEGHGFRKKGNRDFWVASIFTFFTKFL